MLPIHAFIAVYAVYYVFLVPILFGWYTVPVNTVFALLALKGVSDAICFIFVPKFTNHAALSRNLLLWGASALYLLMFVSMLPLIFRTERQIQTLVEEPVRKAIGLYLKAKNDPTLTVAGEPLGYIGYYRGLTYYDYPGLCSRRVVDFLRKNSGSSLLSIVRHFEPNYAVLRAREVKFMADSVHAEWFPKNYVLERRVTVPEADKRKILFIDANIDTDFLLYRKR